MKSLILMGFFFALNGWAGEPRSFSPVGSSALERFESTKVAALAGNVEAQHALGGLYSSGVHADEDAAIYWFTRAATNGFALSQMALGRRAAPRDYVAAFSWFHKAALSGNAQAQYIVGSMLDDGDVMTDNVAGAQIFKFYALKNYRKVDNATYYPSGEPPYRAGPQLQPNWVEARQWYLKAAAQGHSTAMINLGVLYYRGQGVKVDVVEAYKWFRLAGLFEHSSGVNHSKIAAEYMTPDQVRKAIALADSEKVQIRARLNRGGK